MKPRIRKVNGRWVCAVHVTDLRACIAHTPEDAYKGWLGVGFFDAVRNQTGGLITIRRPSRYEYTAR